MKISSRSIGNLSVPLTALAVMALLMLMHRGGTSQASSSGGHPATCHACSTIPPGSSARFNEFLIKHGYAEDLSLGD